MNGCNCDRVIWRSVSGPWRQSRIGLLKMWSTLGPVLVMIHSVQTRILREWGVLLVIMSGLQALTGITHSKPYPWTGCIRTTNGRMDSQKCRFLGLTPAPQRQDLYFRKCPVWFWNLRNKPEFENPGLGIRTSSFEGFVLNPGGFPKGVKYLTLLCGGCSGCCVGAKCSLALV